MIEISCHSDDSRSCDTDEMSEYNQTVLMEQSNNFVVDDKKQKQLIIAHLKFIKDPSNITEVR